jgi:hypothetical protein
MPRFAGRMTHLGYFLSFRVATEDHPPAIKIQTCYNFRTEFYQGDIITL